MMTMSGSDMTMPAEPSMARMSDFTMNGGCKVCLKGADDNGKSDTHCPPSCIAIGEAGEL